MGKGGEGREGTYERETRTKQTTEERIGCHRRRCNWSIRRNKEPKDAGENENDALQQTQSSMSCQSVVQETRKGIAKASSEEKGKRTIPKGMLMMIGTIQ